MKKTVTASVASGNCSCGRVQFRAESNPFQVSYCHCSDCRKATGAPVTVFIGFDSRTILFTRENPDIHRPEPVIQRLFCAACGTPIGYIDDRLPNEIYFYSGVFEDPSKFKPELHAWVSEKLDWLTIIDELPRYERFSRSRSS